MKAEGTIAHGGGSTKESNDVKRAVVEPVRSELNGDKYQTAVTCPRMLEEPTCNREIDGSGCEPRTFSSMMLTGLDTQDTGRDD